MRPHRRSAQLGRFERRSRLDRTLPGGERVKPRRWSTCGQPSRERSSSGSGATDPKARIVLARVGPRPEPLRIILEWVGRDPPEGEGRAHSRRPAAGTVENHPRVDRPRLVRTMVPGRSRRAEAAEDGDRRRVRSAALSLERKGERSRRPRNDRRGVRLRSGAGEGGARRRERRSRSIAAARRRVGGSEPSILLGSRVVQREIQPDEPGDSAQEERVISSMVGRKPSFSKKRRARAFT
jgi:hypothetical protein